ncbi:MULTISPECIES: Na(+)-translocating NADH-quinone reductase subunit A [Thiorhodovibrio]|uniref:Na(+)-translocating NADH-quinone reductase subunit A n=1 Tax=Thiorhodovibrio TaxID=61593 RepID=UPI001913779B|nr:MULTISPECIES: Na(+)-translocating NADH-quinone reductase subunit A [Thiorhodovibrio]MBK5968946.1 NADH:ubiquinone reductase (Na(+)-transporting) subunit A [Thiorhodovibrio winogradskyi]WPL10339.1 Na(+)-translocating NADH-quinone reductase subunit A [Thiorhodovibrio litoralis]
MSVKQIRIKRGLSLPVAGTPDQRQIAPAPVVSHVAISGYDVLRPRRMPEVLVQPGDRVKLGQPISRGKAYPQVLCASPGAGVIEAVHRGPRRLLESVVIRLEGDEHETFNSYKREELAGLNAAQVKENLLASGLWLSLRTRPFSRVPAPDHEPAALFIPAMDTRPLAPDPAVFIAEAAADFADGVLVLSKLTGGPVYVCTAPGAPLELPDDPRIKQVEFAGPHPAGLVGTHMHFLHPASLKQRVWHMGYQDCIAVGRLFKTGRIDPERVISLAGPMVAQPRLIRTRFGASTNELVAGQLNGEREARVIAGSALDGRHAVGHSAFLGRFHNQVTVLPEYREREWLGWLGPGLDKFSAQNVYLGGLMAKVRGAAKFALNTNLNGSPRALVPIGAYERVMPLDILPTLLLRALVVDDTETAQDLGALELDEEDLALCSYVDIGKHDFGPMLRRNLNQIWREHQ